MPTQPAETLEKHGSQECPIDAEKKQSDGSGSPNAGSNSESDRKVQAGRRRRRRNKRLWIGEAMRAKGVDEARVAETYAGVLDNLTMKKPSGETEKLLVDVLKECTRLLEPAQTTKGSKAAQIRLIHKVARPKRDKTPKDS